MDIVKITTNIENFRNDIADEIRAFNHNAKEYKGEGEYFNFEVNVEEKSSITVTIKTDIFDTEVTRFLHTIYLPKPTNLLKKVMLSFALKYQVIKY